MLIGLHRRACAVSSLSLICALWFVVSTPAFAQQSAAPENHSRHMQEHASPQDHSGHGGMTMPSPEKKAPAKKNRKSTKETPAKAMPGMGGDHADMTAGKMPDMHGGHDMGAMRAFLGPYASVREGSGTSWLPDTTPHEGIHAKYGDWNTMWHANFTSVVDQQGGPRGGNKAFATGMLMGMAERNLGDGTLGVRAMMSPEPFMGRNGYPLLFATGETANGTDHLVDRQHPHELFMELATTYSKNLSANSSAFIYAGLPGEPALGPSAFMHRTSGMDIPEAPITHHWLDSTHITFGVVTAGLVVDKWKLEASAFRGREPDQFRYDIEAPKLDSVSARLSWNPAREWSMQVSWGRLHSPEQLDPDVDENRVTASATYTKPFGDNVWSTTAAWGRKMLNPGVTTDAFLLESSLLLQQRVTLFARAEHVQESELFGDTAAEALFGSPHPKFDIAKISVGGIYDFVRTEHSKLGIGALVSAYDIPGTLAPYYGDPTSTMVFVRLKVM